MLSVVTSPIMLSVFMLNVIMPSVVVPCSIVLLEWPMLLQFKSRKLCLKRASLLLSRQQLEHVFKCVASLAKTTINF